MIDGIQFTHHSDTARLTKLPIWEVLVYEATGAKVNDYRTTCIRGMHLHLKPRTNTNGFTLLANGSLPMWYNAGNNNACSFDFYQLTTAIQSITSALTVSPSNCEVHGIEIGVNIPLPYNPKQILKNAVCYKGKPFTQINTRQYTHGVNCSLTDYNVKLYSKTAQSNTANNILRLEIQVHKMRLIKGYNIATLADLQNPSKVYQLKNLLIEALDQIIFTDTKVQLHTLSNREQKQWLAVSNPLQWQNLNKRKAYRERQKAKLLLQKHGKIIDLKPQLLQAWENSFVGINPADKTGLFHRQNLENEADKNGTISQLECTVKKSHFITENIDTQNTTFLPNNTILKENIITKNSNIKMCENVNKNSVRHDAQPATKCQTCKRDISTQRKGSKFCSEVVHGAKAKACRNKASNKTRTIKRQLTKATKQNIFVAITYLDAHGTAYTDILHPTELSIQPNQYQTIVDVKPMPPPV